MSSEAPAVGPLRVAVVGHIEWVEFLLVDGAVSSGAIVHAASDGAWHEAAGGGAVAAAELARLAGACTLHTALGWDPVRSKVTTQLASLGVDVQGQHLDEPHRRGVTFLEPSGERTIAVIGSAQSVRGDPMAETALEDVDGVYFCKGDVMALRRARAAKVLVATARVLETLQVGQSLGIAVDALVGSANDRSERYQAGDLDPPPRLVVRTNGARGGTWTTADGCSGQWQAAALPGPLLDTYGAGDSFAAGLTYALAADMTPQLAVEFAATRGALAVCRRGAHGST